MKTGIKPNQEKQRWENKLRVIDIYTRKTKTRNN